MTTAKVEFPRVAYRVKEYARMTGQSIWAVYSQIERGELPARKHGGSWLIPAAYVRREFPDPDTS